MSCGTTTNESYKWGIVRAYYKRRAKEAAARKKNDGGDSAAAAARKSGRYGPAKSAKARPLEQRPDADFPDEVPANIYDRGFFKNWMVVVRPGEY